LTRTQLSHPPTRLSTSTDVLTPFTQSETFLYCIFSRANVANSGTPTGINTWLRYYGYGMVK
jgi:hypothetical protein